MKTKYYYDKDDITTGPFTLDQLVEMERQGRIHPDTRILVEDNKDIWTTWAQVPRNAGASGGVSAPAPPDTDAAPWCWGTAWVILVLSGVTFVWSLFSISEPIFLMGQLLTIICLACMMVAFSAALYALGSIVRWLHIQTELQRAHSATHKEP